MQNVIEIIKTMPRKEIIDGIMFAIGFPIIFWAVWVMTPA